MTPADWHELAGGSVPFLALDFDGTVTLGDGPVVAYADAVIDEYRRTATPAEADRFAASLRGGLDAYLRDGTLDGATETIADGYGLIVAVAGDRIDQASLDRAYVTSRRSLADGAWAHGELSAPDGLAETLAALAGSVRRVVVTNAPATGVVETLRRIGIADHLDGVVTDAGKPSGWGVLLPPLLARRPAPAFASVGDVWRNDLAAPLDAGAVTMLVDRFDLRLGPAHAAAADLTSLLGDIRAWAADPSRYAADHPPRRHAVPLASRP